MDETVFVILLLTGFCIPSTSFPNIYYFIREEMTWDDALHYCISEYAEMAQIDNMENMTEVMNTPSGQYTDKAWIGLYANISEWTWVDEQPAVYFSWTPGQPDDINADEFCAGTTVNGTWKDYSCSEKKAAVCFSDNLHYFIAPIQMSWTDAEAYCGDQNSTLATVPDEKTNYHIQTKLARDAAKVEEAWIGLYRPSLWCWTETGQSYTFVNWQSEQPDNLNGKENCAAMVVKDGTWTDEDCNAMYPFFCYGIYKSLKTVVRMKIHSSASVEDQAAWAYLKEQLIAAFVKRGVTDFRLTWKSLPLKQTQESSYDYRCPVTL